jgi:hypothetical protein
LILAAMMKEMIDEFKQLLPGSRRRLPFAKFEVDVFQELEFRCGVIIKGVHGKVKKKVFDRFDVCMIDESDGRSVMIRSNVNSDGDLRIFGYLVEFVLCELAKTPHPKSVDILASIQTWLEFSKSTRKKLSRSKQIGLFGELWFLETLIDSMPAVNHLDGWTGPDGSPVDFSFGEGLGVEVKSRLQPFKDWLGITSAAQLDNALPRLHIIVCDFVPTDSGFNLRETVENLKNKFETFDERFRFLDALAKVGYDHFAEYSNFFRVKHFGMFALDARSEGFPILKKPEDLRIDRVKYEINTWSLDRLNPEITYSIIRNQLGLN